MTAIEWEPLAVLLRDGMADCTVEQWHESGRDHADVPLAVDWARYQAAEDAGILRILAARRNGELAGWNAVYIAPHSMYATTLHAMNDSIYVKPSQRGIGLMLVLALERKLAGCYPGRVIRVVYCAQHGDRWKEALNRLGYATVETVQSKLLRT